MSYSLKGKKHSYHDTHLSTLDKTVKYWPIVEKGEFLQ